MVVMEAASSSPSAPWRTEPRRLGKSTARELRRFTALGTRAPAAGSSAVSEAVEARRLKVFVLSLVGGRRREEAGKEEVGRKVLVGGGKEEKERGRSSKEEEGVSAPDGDGLLLLQAGAGGQAVQLQLEGHQGGAVGSGWCNS